MSENIFLKLFIVREFLLYLKKIVENYEFSKYPGIFGSEASWSSQLQDAFKSSLLLNKILV
jgi:hypothetical protein